MKKYILRNGLGIILVCAALLGCAGSDNAEETNESVETEQEVIEEDTEEAIVMETTKPPKTAEEVSGTWFENSGLDLTPAGNFTYFTSNYLASDGDVDTDVTLNAHLSIDTVTNDDETKTITAILSITPWIGENGAWGWSANYGFVDQYTGISIVCSNTDSQTYSIEYEGQIYEISVVKENVSDGGVTEDVIRKVSIICPVEYDGALFFVCGSNTDIDNNIVVDTYDSFENIEHGSYDILLFEGIDTEVEDTAETEDAQEEKTTQESTGVESSETAENSPVESVQESENTSSDDGITYNEDGTWTDESGLIYQRTENGDVVIVGGVVFGD